MLYGSYHAPTTLEEGLALLAEKNGARVKPIAGGTDLMIQLREHMVQVDTLVDVSGIDEIKRITLENGRVHLGGAVTYAQLVESRVILQHAYLLHEASRVIGASQIQHMGTIGGNLANASPAGDTLPCFNVLDASLTLARQRGSRIVPIADFMLGVRRTVLEPDELIIDVAFDALPPHAGSAFTKLGLRHRQAISVVDAAAVVFVEGDVITEVRIALGSVAPTIVRGISAENILRGEQPSAELFERAGEAARDDISPIDDIRGSAAYRTYVTKPLVAEALEKACARAGAEQEKA